MYRRCIVDTDLEHASTLSEDNTPAALAEPTTGSDGAPSKTNLLGVAPHHILRVRGYSRNLPLWTLAFSEATTPSAIAQYAIKQLRHAARQMSDAGE
jgi:hypothetical protein